jgi:hypothetical protein
MEMMPRKEAAGLPLKGDGSRRLSTGMMAADFRKPANRDRAKKAARSPSLPISQEPRCSKAVRTEAAAVLNPYRATNPQPIGRVHVLLGRTIAQ